MKMSQFDPEGFGEIPWDDFAVALRSPDFRAHVDEHKIEQLVERIADRRTTAITFQDFVNVVSHSLRVSSPKRLICIHANSVKKIQQNVRCEPK